MVSRKSSTTSPAKIAANRRNALKSTGPRTAAGKRRAMLNAVTRDVCPEEFERELRARGEDPWEFCRLHRDLIAIFRPQDRADVLATQSLAQTWWEKARRTRQWIAAGSARTADLDACLERLLRLLIHAQRKRHEWWHHRLASVLGRPVGSPADVRSRIESRLFIFGAKPGRRKYPRQSSRERLLEEFRETFGQVLPGAAPRPAGEPQERVDETGEAKRTQVV